MAQETIYSLADRLYAYSLNNIITTLQHRYNRWTLLSDLCQLTNEPINDSSIGMIVMNNVPFVTNEGPSHYITPNNLSLSDFLYSYIKATAHEYNNIVDLYDRCLTPAINDNSELDHYTNTFNQLDNARNLLAEATIIMYNIRENPNN